MCAYLEQSIVSRPRRENLKDATMLGTYTIPRDVMSHTPTSTTAQGPRFGRAQATASGYKTCLRADPYR